MPATCPDCGTPVGTNESHCPVCGRSLQAGPPPPHTTSSGRHIVTGRPPSLPSVPSMPSAPAVPPPAQPTTRGGRNSRPAVRASTSPVGSGSPRPPRGAPIEGVVTGGIVIDQIYRSALAGRTLLRFAVPALVILALTDAALIVIKSVASIVATLLPIIIVLVTGKMIFSGRAGGTREKRPRREHGAGLFRDAAKGGSHLIGSAVSSSSRAGNAVSDPTTEVRRFRVDTLDGQRVDCELVGDLRGPAPRQGDSVKVFGRAKRRGVFVVRRLIVETTGALVTARKPITFLLSRVALVTALVILLGVLAVVAKR